MNIQLNEPAQLVKNLMVLIGVLLSSVTAISVGMAVFSLIESLFMASVFAAAAVLLDFYKYLAWPVSIATWHRGKKTCALLMMLSASLLGAISGWATYDRMHGSITSTQHRSASEQHKLSELNELRELEVDRLDSVDQEAKSLGAQAMQLRERGMISKAQDLDALAMASSAEQRRQILTRIDKLRAEISDLQNAAMPSAGLPDLLLVLLCIGFALSLEVVPALLGAALRDVHAKRSEREPSCNEVSIAVVSAKPAEKAGVVHEVREVTDPPTSTPLPAPTAIGQQHELFGSDDSRLMQTLIQMTQATTPGTPIKVRDFTATAKVGNRRTIKLFHAAMEVGLLKRTNIGYVAA